MFSIFGKRPTSHVISQGNVGCPVHRKDVDIEGCLACQRLREVRVENGVEVVRCETEERSTEPPFG